MERSTTDVVGGALLAENAGAALQEIEQVSNQIASLVQNISASARGQSSAAQNIARNMQVLREISAQSADSTSATSQAIVKLADLSAALRKSITGFRLPGGGDTAGVHRGATASMKAATSGLSASLAGPAGPATPDAPGTAATTGVFSGSKIKALGGS
jgi:twitching motility protein PilJ